MKMFVSLLQLGAVWVILLGNAVAQPQMPQNQQNQAYFSVLTDIPLMPAMKELTDQAFVFDKAEGRVVEAVGFLSVSDTERPLKFYETALAQLGWKSLKTAVFQRNNEQLVVRAEKLAQGVVVRFQLSPLSR